MEHETDFHEARSRRHAWQARFFTAMASRRCKVLRCAKQDAERELGYEALHAAVKARGFHLVECGDQYVIICDSDRIWVHH